MQTLNIKILDNHNMEKPLWDIDDFIFEWKRLCLAPGYIKNEDGSVEILEFSIYHRDMETWEIIYK